MTALMLMAILGQTDAVRVLLDAGTGSGDGRSALSYAEEKDHAEIVGVLKLAGAK